MSDLFMMQGRLLPPTAGALQAFPGARWQAEFPLAEQLGLAGIELIVDGISPHLNPVLDPGSGRTLAALLKRHKLSNRSVCADVILEHPFASDPAGALARLERLIDDCARIRTRGIVIPLVDRARLKSADDVHVAAEVVRTAAQHAVRRRIELHLETDLSPHRFESLLDTISSDQVWANYDTGNSASLGYDAREELAAYGERIGSVHVKDRRLRGETVPLGQGAADLLTVFRALSQLGYNRGFVLQIARGAAGEEFEWAQANIHKVGSLLTEAGL